MTKKDGELAYIYVVRLTDDEQLHPRPIATVEGLKEEIIRSLSMEHQTALMGWSPEEYTKDNITDFNDDYSNIVLKVKESNMDEIIGFIKKHRITLSWVDPITELKEQDFEDGYNPVFVDVDIIGEFLK